MEINNNETWLCTIEKIKQFLGIITEIEFSMHGDEYKQYCAITALTT